MKGFKETLVRALLAFEINANVNATEILKTHTAFRPCCIFTH